VAALPKLVGSVDPIGRPVVRVAVMGRDDEMLATIDTGFNGELMMGSGDAELLGVAVREQADAVELGHGQRIGVGVGLLRIRWLDAERTAKVLISDQRELRRTGPVALIGTALLKPHLLLIDFAQGTVEIETQD